MFFKLLCSRHYFVSIFFCSFSLLVECFWFKFLNIFLSGHFGFTSLIFFTTSFELFFFQKTFLVFLLLPFVPTSFFFSADLSLVLFAFKYFYFCLYIFFSAWRYFVILVSLLFLFSVLDSYVETFVTPDDLSEFVFFSFFRSHALSCFFLRKIWNICKKTGLQQKNVKHSQNRLPNGVPRTGGRKNSKSDVFKEGTLSWKNCPSKPIFFHPFPPQSSAQHLGPFLYKNV